MPKTRAMLMVEQHMDQCLGELDELAHALCRTLRALGVSGSVNMTVLVTPSNQATRSHQRDRLYDITTGMMILS